MLEFKKSKLVPSIDIALQRLEGFTKKLKVMRVGSNTEKRKLVVSSKLLSVVGMGEGVKVVVEPLDVTIESRLCFALNDENTVLPAIQYVYSLDENVSLGQRRPFRGRSSH